MFRSCQIIIRELCSLLKLYYSIHNSIRICNRGVVAAYHVVWECVVEQWLGVRRTTLTAFEQDHDGKSWSCSQAVSKPVWHIPLLCVQWKTPDDGHRNCPKRVEFYSKNKFEKLVQLAGFIIRIYHDARSPERQKNKLCFDWMNNNAEFYTYAWYNVFLWNWFFTEMKAIRTSIDITGVPRVQPLLRLIKRRVYMTHCGVITPGILNLCSRRRWPVRFTLRPLLLRSQNTGTHWLDGWVRFTVGLATAGDRNISYSCRESNPDPSIFQSTAYSIYTLAIWNLWKREAGFGGPAQTCRHIACLQVHCLNFIWRNSCMNNSFEYACWFLTPVYCVITCSLTATSSVCLQTERTMSDFFKQINNLLRDFFLTRKHRLPMQSPWIIRPHFLILYLYRQNKTVSVSWVKRDQLDVTCFIISLFNAQHVWGWMY